MKGETFKNNGDMTLDAINKFGEGVITASPTDLSISQILAAPSTSAASFG